MRKLIYVVITVILLFPISAFSANISIFNVLNYSVSESMMNGMKVDIDFSTGPDWQGYWGLTPTGKYGVEDIGWSLTYSGINTNNYGFDWVLATDRSVNSFTINAIYGNTVFDIMALSSSTRPYIQIAYDTPGSSGGLWGPIGAGTSVITSGWVNDPHDAVLNRDYNARFYWEFKDPVFLYGSSGPKGDLYSKLFIDFTKANSGNGFISSNGKNFQFVVDTDNVTPIPEPSTFFLLGFGLLGTAAIRRK